MLFTEPHTESMWVAEEKLDLKYTEPVGSLWENLPDFAARVWNLIEISPNLTVLKIYINNELRSWNLF